MSKVCIVTGASQGLGRGIAKVLAEEESATVYATARSEQALNELASSVEVMGQFIHLFLIRTMTAQWSNLCRRCQRKKNK